ncbi:unnamed protein product, partial [Rotaria magnacalcarata]
MSSITSTTASSTQRKQAVDNRADANNLKVVTVVATRGRGAEISE